MFGCVRTMTRREKLNVIIPPGVELALMLVNTLTQLALCNVSVHNLVYIVQSMCMYVYSAPYLPHSLRDAKVTQHAKQQTH